MIREATHSDLDAMVALAKAFHDESDAADWGGFEPGDVRGVLMGVMDGQFAVVVEADGQVVGMMACMAYPAWMNRRRLIGQELIWYVLPAHRSAPLAGEMLTAAERWARSVGCSTFEMGCLDSNRPEAVARLYRRRGYRPKERLFWKEWGEW